MLAVIATVLVFWALKATRPVTLPPVFGTVLLLFFRPLQKRLNARLPNWVSIVTIVLITLAFLAVLGGLLYYSATVVAPEVPQYAERARQRLQGLSDRLQQQGITLPLPGMQESERGTTQSVGSDAFNLLGNLATGLSLTVLTLTVLVFLLFEADGFRDKLRTRLESDSSRRVLDAFGRMSGKFTRYFVVQAFTSVLTGLLTYLYCLLLGVEFAFVWGVVGFAFNFVPTVGSILAVVPPTLFAAAFSGLGQAALLLLGLALIQLALGNFVDPALQGKAVKLAPVVVLLSVVFWGWLWGIGGAIIAVPVTVALVLLLQEFDATRPVAVLLSEPGAVDKEDA